MSLLYKLFGKPTNVGEFTDKVFRNNVSNVEIMLGEGRTELGSGASYHHCPLTLNAGKYIFKVDGDSALNVWGENPNENEIRNMITQHNALVRAIRIGKYLEKQWLKVHDNGKLMDIV